MMTDLNLLLFRLVVGAFFVLYRFRWVYDPAISNREAMGDIFGWPIFRKTWSRWLNRERHARLEAKLMECGYAPQLAVPVAVAELLAGIGLIIGFLTQWCALGLLVILIAATVKTARQKVVSQKPVDAVDWASCYLWLSEPLYIVLCYVLLVEGGGALAFDRLMP